MNKSDEKNKMDQLVFLILYLNRDNFKTQNNRIQIQYTFVKTYRFCGEFSNSRYLGEIDRIQIHFCNRNLDEIPTHTRYSESNRDRQTDRGRESESKSAMQNVFKPGRQEQDVAM